MHINQSQAIELMNELGLSRVPFLFIIDFEMKKPIVISLNDLKDGDVLFDFDGFRYCHPDYKTSRHTLKFVKHPVSFDQYKCAFDKLSKHFNQGNIFLVNLTFPTNLEMDVDLRDIFYWSHAKYRLLYRNEFVVFSPEIFVKIDDGIISSYPMKGTITASEINAEKKLLLDEKELAEHITIVDLIRNDLSMVAGNVRVEKFRYIDQITTNEGKLLQTSSKISGKLAPDYNKKIGDILFALLPAGSISGAPKPKTLEIIHEVEDYARGYYTGVFGYFDGMKLDSAVMIRFIERSADEKLCYKSGGGITVYSDPVKEYEEMIKKIYVPIS